MVIRRVKEALEVMGGKLSVKTAYHLRAILPVDGEGAVETDVRIYSEGGIQLISVTRQMGDPLGFQKVFRAFRAQTVDLHGEEGEDANNTAEESLGSPFGKGGPTPLEEGEEMGLANDDGML